MSRCLNFQIQRIQSGEAITQIELLLHSLNAQAKARTVKVLVDFCITDDYCNVFVESSEPTKLWKNFAAFVAENSREFEWIKSVGLLFFRARLAGMTISC
jgi:hypothetical protein